ncbi:MAG: DUF6630 family protein [Sulfitobacter sp.]
MAGRIWQWVLAAVGAPGRGPMQEVPEPAAPLSAAEVLAALRELTQNDQTALRAARQMMAGDVHVGEPYSFYAKDYPNMAALGHGLWEAGRLIELDWAEGLEPVTESFEMLLAEAGIDWPGGAVPEQGLLRGDALGAVFVQVWPQVRRAGYHIMGLNCDSDLHLMFLAPAAAALRWQSVQIGRQMYLEIADWHFAEQMAAAGHLVTVPGHPAGHLQDAPQDI